MQRQTRLELEMGGETRPLLFDFTFLDFLTDEVPLDELDTIGAKKPWRLIPLIAKAALSSGADFEGKPVSFNLKQVTQWVEQMEPLDANKIMECYKTAMGFIGTVLSGKAAESPAP